MHRGDNNGQQEDIHVCSEETGVGVPNDPSIVSARKRRLGKR